MPRRWSLLILLFSLVLSITPAAARVVPIDPAAPPASTLDPAEVAKLATLQDVDFPILLSEVSPDDTAILTGLGGFGRFSLTFVNVHDGATVPVDSAALALPPFTEVAWRDTTTAVYLSDPEADPEDARPLAPVLVALDRTTGTVVTEPVDLPGFPISLAPNATQVLVAIPSPDGPQAQTAMESPFDLEVQRRPFERVGPTRFDADDQAAFRLSSVELQIAVYDLTTQELVELMTVPAGSGLYSQPTWTPDGTKVAFSRITIPNFERGNTRLSDLSTQDALGNLPPAQNPFFQGNVVDVFDLETGDFRPAVLQAAAGTGELFGRVSWSPDGQTLLTQMEQPARLDGRRYPIYLFPDRTYLRFYDPRLRQIGVLKRSEIEAPFFAVPVWIAPDEVVINAPVGLTYRLFHYNRASGKFRSLTTDDGTYYQVSATRQSQQLIFNFSSFQQPYELYRLGWSDSERATLTDFNAEQAKLNAIRADQVTFKLRSGATRTGYLLQPADAAFPPRKVPIVMWQQGGPMATITSEWGTFVEQPFNLLPNFGIAVLVVPLPGRVGFGPEFYKALYNGRNFGQIDIDEGVEIVQHLIKQGYTTPDHVGITGCSYGGYYTSQSITQHPAVYAAANTQCSLLDLIHEWQFGWTPIISQFMGRAPTDDPKEYTKDSPLYNASRVRTPLLIFHGTEDFLPILTALNFHDQIEANGTPVLFLQFQDEGHGLEQPTSQLTAGQAQIRWFREYLEGVQR